MSTQITKRVFARDIKVGDVIIYAFASCGNPDDIVIILANVTAISSWPIGDWADAEYRFDYVWAQGTAPESPCGMPLVFGHYDFVNVL